MNILTFDIEEWFHCDFISSSNLWNTYEVRIHNNVDLILDILNIKKRKATFFIIGWIAERYPEVVKKIHLEGHEIGGHSMMHGLVHQMDRLTFRDDTKKNIEILEDITGHKVELYRAPGFSITEDTPWAFEELVDLGIKIDASVFPASHDYGGFKSFGEAQPSLIKMKDKNIKEFPMNVKHVFGKSIVFSGGGYFRLFPYSVIKKWTNNSDYVMSYFHPRDFDFLQPVINELSTMRKFKSYVGLKNAYRKFVIWLDANETVSIMQADKLVDWKKAKIISINE
ncbi:MAG: DUF3473 domain-containing protein [Bacteroidales bacterium]|nr:DUF3473 domain-containing protein [Bacteroidales bacterium]